jgi:hypothetical protein
MFDDCPLDWLKEKRAELRQKLLANAGLGSFSLPDGVSISLDSNNAKEILTAIVAEIRRREGRGGRFVAIEVQP